MNQNFEKIMSSKIIGRIRPLAHPITSARWPLPGAPSKHPNVQRDHPMWEQKLTDGKFHLRDPLRDAPDWTYFDGRPSPLNEKQLALKMHQIDLANQIVQGLKQLKQAETEHANSVKKERQMLEAMQQAKPRAKGVNHPRVGGSKR